MNAPPVVHLYNRQRRVLLEVSRLRAITSSAVRLCLEHPGDGRAALGELPEVEISLVSDAAIARLHARFLDDPTPTDVITFEHGELIVSADTAARQARELGETLERELARYIVHGLLHLNGHEDDRPEAAAAMWRAQEIVVAALSLGQSP